MRWIFVLSVALLACGAERAAQALPASCRGVLALEPEAASDVYTIFRHTTGGTVSTEVYCDMVTDGGGWTLVARSAPGHPDVPFGWKVRAGFLHDLSAPYSLDATRLTFTEVLVGAQSAGNSWGGSVFKLTVPGGLLSDYGSTDVEVTGIAWVRGVCNPEHGPHMLSHVGHTDTTAHIYFRDSSGNDDIYGLSPDGFVLNYDDCDFAGTLNGTQGLIFVR